ncbi:MAG TPA: 2TM domain-containing protein [Phenylobacterium sp.]
MSDPIDHEQLKLEWATRRVSAVRAFYMHLAVFAVVAVLVLAIYRINYGAEFNGWVTWPLVGWAASLVLHGVFTFLFGPKWELQQIETLIETE